MRDLTLKNINYKKALTKINSICVCFFTAGHCIFPLKQQLKSGDLKKGIDYLKSKYPVFKPRSVKFLLHLYQYLVQLKSNIAFNNIDKKKLILHFCCWGEAYTQKAVSFLLPSLMTEGNLPSVSKDHEIFILIHCDKESKETFEQSKVYNVIKKYAQFEMAVVPDDLFKRYVKLSDYMNFLFLKEVNRCNLGLRYLLLGALQGHALREGIQHDALISFLIPDSILSDSFLAYSIEKIQDKKLVLTTTFRTDYIGVKSELEKNHNPDKTICTVSGATMSKLQVQYLHRTEKRRVISVTTNHFLACARFIFKHQNGLSLRAVHYHPVLLDCSKLNRDLKIDYFPIDDAVLKQILVEPYEEQAWICSDTNQMNFMELSDLNPEVNEPPVYVAPSTYESLLHSIYLLFKACPKDLDEKLNRFLIKNELKFVSEGAFADEEVIDSDHFLSDLYQKVDAE